MVAVATGSSNIRERNSLVLGLEVGLVELTSNSRSDDDDGPKEKSGSSRSIAVTAAIIYSCTPDRHLNYICIYIFTTPNHTQLKAHPTFGGGEKEETNG